MDSPSDIELLCRLCLVKDQVNIPIFEEQGDIRQIFLKISSCLPVSVSREDNLPKKICDGCLDKLDLLYDFWNTSVNAEKTLLTWLGQAGVKDADETITAVAQQIAKPETQVKVEDHETNVDGGVVEEFEEEAKDEEEPPPKRARRSAAVKAQMTLTNDSDEDEDDDFDTAEPMTKMEDESEESEGEEKDPSYNDVPGTSADDQPGPSGLGKDGADAPPKKPTIKNFMCNYCARPFTRKRNLDAHIVTKHTKEYRFKCPQCGMGFYSNFSLKRHRKVVHDHAKKYPYQCPICQKGFKLQTYLNSHIPRHQPESLSKYRCSNCNKVYSHRVSLWRHEDHCKGLTSLVKCDLCDKVLDSSKLYSHRRLTHGERKHECDICHKKFKENWYLQKHILMHKGLLRWPCDVCGQTFASRLTANLHKKAKHSKEFSAFCEVCGKGFVNMNQLNCHVKRAHRPEDEPPQSIRCPVAGCDKAYRSSSSLKLHLPSHLEDKPVYPCSHCEKIMHHPVSLRRHMKNSHSDGPKKIHQCHICQKELSGAANLRDHIRTHTGEKPFQCESCCKSFTTRELLRVHGVVHTKEKPYVCRICNKGFTQYGSLKSHFVKGHPTDQWLGAAKDK